MASEKTHQRAVQDPGFGSENTPSDDQGPGAPDFRSSCAAALDAYASALERSPLSDKTRKRYLGKVRDFLAWATESDEADAIDGEPLDDARARDWAVADYKRHLKNGRAEPATIGLTLAALDDFYVRRGLGKTTVRRERIARRRAPRALDERRARRYLRAVDAATGSYPQRDRVVGLLPYLAGLRIAEVVALDTDDVSMSARKGSLRVTGKGSDGGKIRHVPIQTQLRDPLQELLDVVVAAYGPGPLIRNARGARLNVRSAYSIVVAFGDAAGLCDDASDPFSPHVLRHTFGYRLVRSGVDLVIVAELMGHERLETTRLYSLPTHEDMAAKLDVLVDE